MSLFHYTDANAVLSIIQNSELWLTDIRFMNDSDESLDGTRYVIQAISDLLPENEPSDDRALEWLREFSEKEVTDGQLDEHAFICSFSRAGDHLVQWRSYGLYALKFHDSLATYLEDFYDCFYEDVEKKRAAAEYVALTRRAIAAELRQGEQDSSIPVLQHMWKLADFVNQFKHHSFREENEIRLIRLKSSFDKDIQYRARGDYVLPYLRVKFLLEHVKAIHIGPMRHQDLAVISMRSFIHNFEMKRREVHERGDFKIQIIPSAIPYRQT